MEAKTRRRGNSRTGLDLGRSTICLWIEGSDEEGLI
jgi:hypothetical protein